MKYLTSVIYLFFCGCTTTTLTKGDIKFSRTTIASDHQVKALTVTSTTNGSFSVSFEGYQSNAETKQVIEGAIKALK